MITIDNSLIVQNMDSGLCQNCAGDMLFLKDSEFKKDGKVYSVYECEDCGTDNLVVNK